MFAQSEGVTSITITTNNIGVRTGWPNNDKYRFKLH